MDHIDRIVSQWSSARPDLDVGPMETIGRLLRLSMLLRSEMENTWKTFGLNSASFDVLATLRRSGKPNGLSPGELLELTMVTSGTMTNRVDQLVKAGLVRRVQNRNDKRGFLIRLTDEGMTVIEAAVTDHVETQHRLMDGLSVNQKDELNGLLIKLTASVKTGAD
ncbi:DNA-binding MarR family transcriptional regulator [Yoonia maritima]|uniref:DNA-binding MarR family transcriptional regulator n=1 Tax=Yoonia maritima TaxID=1435347 RepID=A0A2T0VUT3_9RHOB|nr:MarR family transcriptional regulator [Yoonia maritima]PRY75300.1 DNA-binding MarR family transcriptional regulator [Yoonia maritima]